MYFIYDQPHNESFYNNDALTINGAIKGTSKLKNYDKLSPESLKFRRWIHCLCVFYKIKTWGHPEYLDKLIPAKSSSYNTANSDHIEKYYCRTDIFKYRLYDCRMEQTGPCLK